MYSQISVDNPLSLLYSVLTLNKETDMIKNSKQTWEIGEMVKVGFLTLKVLAKVPTPGDYMPDAYALGSAKGGIYRFVPHNGLTKCASLEEAMS
jgi:hypothetical protein